MNNAAVDRKIDDRIIIGMLTAAGHQQTTTLLYALAIFMYPV